MATSTDKPPYLDVRRPVEARAADLASRLTLEEKVALMAGAAAFTLEGVERLGVPRVNVTDGPTGVRSNEGEPATVFPVGVALASTWNVDLAREVGAAIAREALALGSRVVLAPTINIMRTPHGGGTSKPTPRTRSSPARLARPTSRACRAKASAPR